VRGLVEEGCGGECRSGWVQHFPHCVAFEGELGKEECFKW